MVNKVAIYVRVSTTNQAEEGYSIDEQKDKLKSYCVIKDWNIYDIYTDGGFSGANTERPALEKLIRDAKSRKFDTVLVYKLDRLSRSQKDTLYLIEDVFLKNDISFFSLQENFDTSSPFGKAMIGLLSVFAQLEREQIKERMDLGKIGRAKAGKSMMWTKVAYGYDYHKSTGKLEINVAQSIAVKFIFEQYLSGRAITKLRDDLNDKFPKEIAWSYRIVRAILENPVYCGYNKYKGEVYKGSHEPIISKEMFDKTQEELKHRQIKAAKMNNNPRPFRAKYLLSGMAQCGYCHAPLMLSMSKPRKDGYRSIRYQCHQRTLPKTKGVTVYNDNKQCDSGFYYKEDIEHAVLKKINELQIDKNYIDKIFSDKNDKKIDVKEYQKQIENLNKKIARLNDLYIDDRISLEELQKRSNEFISSRNTLENELNSDEVTKKQKRFDEFKEILKEGNIFEKSYDEQKKIVRALINKVRVTSNEIEILWRI